MDVPALWKATLRGTVQRLRSGGWIANFVVGVVLLLITPLLNGIMQHPRIAILSAAGGLTIIIWVVALAMMRSLPTAPKVDTTQTVTQQQSKSKQEENLKPVPNQAPLPKADSQRFVVALAHLEHDKNQEHERLIREVLKNFEGVQLLQFDRTISLEGTEPEESEKKGHAQAQQYLKDSGAHVLMWGLVLSHDRQSAPASTGRQSRRVEEPKSRTNRKISSCLSFSGTTCKRCFALLLPPHTEYISGSARTLHCGSAHPFHYKSSAADPHKG